MLYYSNNFLRIAYSIKKETVLQDLVAKMIKYILDVKADIIIYVMHDVLPWATAISLDEKKVVAPPGDLSRAK